MNGLIRALYQLGIRNAAGNHGEQLRDVILMQGANLEVGVSVHHGTHALLREELIEQHTAVQAVQHVHTRSYRGGCCLPAVGMMLYAGIRPHEVARLTWEQVDLEGGTISILPQHSKTGGARLVTIHKPLARLLAQFRQEKTAKICPRQWVKHWCRLRTQAGWNTRNHRWQQDALRHTFASYHLRHFRSYSELQYEIGHRDTNLLRTRYVDMSGVRRTKRFWL